MQWYTAVCARTGFRSITTHSGNLYIKSDIRAFENYHRTLDLIEMQQPFLNLAKKQSDIGRTTAKEFITIECMTEEYMRLMHWRICRHWCSLLLFKVKKKQLMLDLLYG